MNSSHLGMGEKIAGGGALVLLISLFLPWYSASLKGLATASGDVTAWEAFSFIDILLFLVAIVVLGLVAAKAAGALPALPAPGGLIIAAAGALALLLILYRLIDMPGPDVPAELNLTVDVSPAAGLIIGLIAAAAVAFGGYRATNAT